MRTDERLTNRQCSGLFRGLALLLHAGVPLADGIYLLAEEETDPLCPLLTQIGGQLDQGRSFSDAAGQSGHFPDYVLGMLQVGEHTGRLEECCEALAAYFDERQHTADRLRSALVYPAMLLLLMLAVIGVLLVKVLPVFDRVYATLGSRLTGIAAGLLQLGRLLQAAMPVLLVVLGLIAATALAAVLVPSFGSFLARVLKQHFGDRGVLRSFNNAHFARALSMGLSSGLPAEEAAALAQTLLADRPAASQRCSECVALLAQNVALPEALRRTGLLSAADGRMLAVGLRSGRGDRVMEEVADRMNEEAAARLEETLAQVEPAMVLAASLLVGAILLTVMLPLMNIMSSIGG